MHPRAPPREGVHSVCHAPVAAWLAGVSRLPAGRRDLCVCHGWMPVGARCPWARRMCAQGEHRGLCCRARGVCARAPGHSRSCGELGGGGGGDGEGGDTQRCCVWAPLARTPGGGGGGAVAAVHVSGCVRGACGCRSARVWSWAARESRHRLRIWVCARREHPPSCRLGYGGGVLPGCTVLPGPVHPVPWLCAISRVLGGCCPRPTAFGDGDPAPCWGAGTGIAVTLCSPDALAVQDQALPAALR